MESKEKNKMENRKIKLDKSGHKKRSIKRFINSIKNSWDGLKYAYTNEQSLTIHAVLTVLVLLSGIIFNATKIQWTVIVIVLALVMIAELINTAIEAVVDLVTDKYHELAKIAKDCASAAAFVASLLAAGLYVYVFLPQIIKLIFRS